MNIFHDGKRCFCYVKTLIYNFPCNLRCYASNMVLVYQEEEDGSQNAHVGNLFLLHWSPKMILKNKTLLKENAHCQFGQYCGTSLNQKHCNMPYLWPFRHFPLRSTALAMAHLSIGWFVKVMWQTQWIVDRRVKAGRQHLPAANCAILNPLSTRPRALTPTTCLPSEEKVGGSLLTWNKISGI